MTARLNTLSTAPGEKNDAILEVANKYKKAPAVMIQSLDQTELPPVAFQLNSSAGLASTAIDSNSVLQQEFNEMMNPTPLEASAKDVTKQMLVTCKVFRKRNSNVTPLMSKRLNQTGNNFCSPKNQPSTTGKTQRQ